MDTKLKVVMALSVIGTVAAAGTVRALDLESQTLVKPAPMYANGVTSPGGLTKIGNDIWVSDHLQGFCRLKASTTLDLSENSQKPTIAGFERCVSSCYSQLAST